MYIEKLPFWLMFCRKKWSQASKPGKEEHINLTFTQKHILMEIPISLTGVSMEIIHYTYKLSWGSYAACRTFQGLINVVLLLHYRMFNFRITTHDVSCRWSYSRGWVGRGVGDINYEFSLRVQDGTLCKSINRWKLQIWIQSVFIVIWMSLLN